MGLLVAVLIGGVYGNTTDDGKFGNEQNIKLAVLVEDSDADAFAMF